MGTVEVNPGMVVLARESLGMSQRDLAESANISQSRLSKIENDVLRATNDDVRRIASATGFRPQLFYCRDRIIGLGSSLLFNRRQKTTQIFVQRQVQARVNLARMQVERLLSAAELVPSGTLQRLDIDDFGGDARQVARRVRAALRIPMGPVASVTRAIESIGGVVVLCNFGTNKIDGAHIWLPGHPPMFFMNADRPGDRHRFNLAHELGHAVMHEFPAGDIERQANEFAAEFLMPSDEIRREYGHLTIESAARLKQRWRVSMSALIYNAHELGCINDYRRKSLYAMLRSMLKGVEEPIVVAREEPILIGQMIRLHRTALGYTDEDFRELFMMDNPDVIEFPGGEGPVTNHLRFDPPPIRFEDHRRAAVE